MEDVIRREHVELHYAAEEDTRCLLRALLLSNVKRDTCCASVHTSYEAHTTALLDRSAVDMTDRDVVGVGGPAVAAREAGGTAIPSTIDEWKEQKL